MKSQNRKQRDPLGILFYLPSAPKSSYEFLQSLRLKVVQYLNWVTHDLVMEDESRALREIQSVADRLTHITSMIPDAAARMMSDYNKHFESEPIGD